MVKGSRRSWDLTFHHLLLYINMTSTSQSKLSRLSMWNYSTPMWQLILQIDTLKSMHVCQKREWNAQALGTEPCPTLWTLPKTTRSNHPYKPILSHSLFWYPGISKHSFPFTANNYNRPWVRWLPTRNATKPVTEPGSPYRHQGCILDYSCYPSC